MCYFQYKDHHRLQKGWSYQVFTWELCAFSHESEPPLKQKQFVFTTLQQRYHQWRWQPEGFQVLLAMWRKFRAIWEIISESFEKWCWWLWQGVLFNKGKDKADSIGHSHILLQERVGKRKVLRGLSGMIPWDQKPRQGWIHRALLAQGRSWCNYVDLGAEYDLVQCWGCADGPPLCWASFGVCWLWKGKHWWDIVFSFERKQRRQSCWRSSKLRFMLIKKFSGVFPAH